jgi:hypothetical protein
MDIVEQQYQAYINEGKTVQQAIADAIEAEREVCAELAKSFAVPTAGAPHYITITANKIANAIRARGV